MSLWGPFVAGSVTDLGDNGLPWTTPANAILSNDDINFATRSVLTGQQTNTLEFKSFGPFSGFTNLDRITKVGITFKRKADNAANISVGMSLVCNSLPADGFISVAGQAVSPTPVIPDVILFDTRDNIPMWNINLLGANMNANFGCRVSLINGSGSNKFYINQMSIYFETDHVEAIPPFRLTGTNQPIITRYDPVTSG